MFDTFFQSFLLFSAHLSICVFDNANSYISTKESYRNHLYPFGQSTPPLLNPTNLCFLKPKIVQGSKIQLLAISIASDSFNW